MARGKFITFEGIDGAGKTTHLGWFRERLEQQVAATGRSVVMTREPGGTPLGETAARDRCCNQPMDLETEALLMFAARREHLAQVIEPALARGDWVLSDRFTDATFAYQGGGRGLPRDKLETLERWVQGGFQPDLTVLFDVAARRRQRTARRGAPTGQVRERVGGVFRAYARRISAPGRRSRRSGSLIIDSTRRASLRFRDNLKS